MRFIKFRGSQIGSTQEKAALRHITIKFSDIKNKERILKVTREKPLIIDKGVPHQQLLSRKEARRQWDNIFKILGVREDLSIKNTAPAEPSIRNEREKRLPQTNKN